MERRASLDKNVEPHSSPQNNPAEDPFGSVPFISHPGKLHYVTSLLFMRIHIGRKEMGAVKWVGQASLGDGRSVTATL